jgi:hypothetical protein
MVNHTENSLEVNSTPITKTEWWFSPQLVSSDNLQAYLRLSSCFDDGLFCVHPACLATNELWMAPFHWRTSEGCQLSQMQLTGCVLTTALTEMLMGAPKPNGFGVALRRANDGFFAKLFSQKKR